MVTHIHVCQQLDKPFKFWKAELYMMLGQIELWKKYYDAPTKLYCDSNTKQIIESIGILDAWDEVDSTLLDESIDINKTQFWSSGKIRVMQAQQEPYVMSDLDFICFEKLSRSDFFFYDLGVYHKEMWFLNNVYSSPREKLKEAKFKPTVSTCWMSNPFNMSFVFMGGMVLNKQFTENSINYMKEASKIESPKFNRNQYTVFAEQQLLAAIVGSNGNSYKLLVSGTYRDKGKWYHNDEGLWSLHDNWKHSMHLWLDKYNFAQSPDRQEWYIETLMDKIYSIDPEIHDRIQLKLSQLDTYNEYLRL
jgi:hypothetical protein